VAQDEGEGPKPIIMRANKFIPGHMLKQKPQQQQPQQSPPNNQLLPQRLKWLSILILPTYPNDSLSTLLQLIKPLKMPEIALESTV